MSNNIYAFFEVEFSPNPLNRLGLQLSYRSNFKYPRITSFETIAAAMNSTVKLQINDEIIQINGQSLESMNSAGITALINTTTWPAIIKCRRAINYIEFSSSFENNINSIDSDNFGLVPILTSPLYDQRYTMIHQNSDAISKAADEIDCLVTTAKLRNNLYGTKLYYYILCCYFIMLLISGDAIMTPGILDRVPDVQIKVEQVVDSTMNLFERLKLIESKVKKLKK